jgi:serine/threonine protein kinase
MANFDRSHWLGVTSPSTTPGGTYAYMAPELLHPDTHDQSRGPFMRKGMDIYALGMVIYEV